VKGLPRSLVLALGVALGLRLIFMAINPLPGAEDLVARGDGPPRAGDDQNYIMLARSLLAGQGYQTQGHPNTHFMPGWPLLLALPLGLGLGLTGARVLLCLLSTLICLEAYLLADRLISRRAAIAAGWFSALFPPGIWYASTLLSETPAAAAFGLWAVVAVGYVQKGGGARRVVALGLLSGLVALFRAEMIVMTPLPFVARAFLAPIKQQVAAGLAAIVLTLAVLSPWAAYNHHRFGERILLTTAGGLAIWTMARDPLFTWPEYQEAARRFTVPGRPKLTDSRYAAEGMAIIRQRPLPYLRLRLLDLPRFWFGSQTEVVRAAAPSFSDALRTRNVTAVTLKVIGFASQTLYAVGGLLGLFLFARKRAALLPWLIVLAKVAAHALFVQTTRYSLHLAPLLLCYSGATILWSIDRVRGHQAAPADPAPAATA